MKKIRAFFRWLVGRSSGVDVELELAQQTITAWAFERSAEIARELAAVRKASPPIACPCGLATATALDHRVSLTHVKVDDRAYLHILCAPREGMRCVHCAAKLVRTPGGGFEWIEVTEPN